MTNVIDCLLLTFAVVYIVDISGFVKVANRVVFRWLYGSQRKYDGWFIPLFGCSLCLTFWAVTIYSLFIGRWSLVHSVAIGCLCGYITDILNDIFVGIKRNVSNWITSK